jgi:hypothetical protein
MLADKEQQEREKPCKKDKNVLSCTMGGVD